MGLNRSAESSVPRAALAASDALPRSVITRIESTCRAMPNLAAAITVDQEVSYLEIDEMANRVARDIYEGRTVKRRKETGDQRVAALLFDGGFDFLVAALACLKSNTIFVPLDTRWPAIRCTELLDQIAPDILIVSKGAASKAHSRGYLLIEVDCTQRLAGADRGRRDPISTDGIIYGYFTSGSTGRPKCALNRDKGLRNRFDVMTDRFRLPQGARVLQNSRHVFDSALWQLLWPLTFGGSVVLPSGNGGLDLEQTLTLIRVHRVAMTDFVPSVFNLIVDRMRHEREAALCVQSLKFILIGGEEINPKAVFDFLEMVPSARVINTYGPTEASIGMVFHEVTEEDRRRGSIPLGRPIENTAILVLDKEMCPVPVGVVGEAYVGGVGVGAGYLREDDLKQRAFVLNTVAPSIGNTLYRTGDLVHWDDDGQLWFNGRADEQLKIGGVRLEPGEIERCLLVHPSIKEAKIVPYSAGSASPRLIAVVVGEEIDEQILRRHVELRLPSAMVPSEFVWVEEMPLTHNRKVDQVKLKRLLDQRGETRSATGDEPQGPVEHEIADVFRSLLGLSRVGRHEAFQSLGGTSLLAIQLVLMLEERLGTKLDIQKLVNAQSVASLASHIEGSHVPGMNTRGRDPREDALVPLVFDIAPGRQRRPGAVLLTGPTGFIGAHVLEKLSRHREVLCLVHANDHASAERKLQDALDQLEIVPDMARVRVLCGDVTKARLGLDEAALEEVRAVAEAIVHCAAKVRLFDSYDYHFAENVAGTIEAIRIAAMCPGARFHNFGSSSARFECALPESGYDQSKWVAESIVFRAARMGMPTTVYRVGEAFPHSERGIPNRRSILNAILSSGVAIGALPASSGELGYVPVDYIANVVVRECLEGGAGRFDVFDLNRLHAVSFSQLIQWIRALGVPVDAVDGASFSRNLLSLCKESHVSDEALMAWAMLRREGVDSLAALLGSEDLHDPPLDSRALRPDWSIAAAVDVKLAMEPYIRELSRRAQLIRRGDTCARSAHGRRVQTGCSV